MTVAALSVSSIGVSYGDVQAVWDVSFEAYAGSTTALLGRNGSGKTTTLLAVAGMLPLTAGRITLGEHSAENLPAHQRPAAGVALVAENRRIFRRRTVDQNLRLGGWPHRGDRRRLAELTERCFTLFPVLRDRRSTEAGELSGGQQQMVAIAQALMADPKVLLLDEPSAGLAPIIVEQMLTTVSTLTADGLAVVLVEQQLENVLPVFDRLVVIDQGRAVHAADATDVDEDVIRRIYLDGSLPTA
ncbi:ABC transporter ATP-binding protein [Streptomyces mirabilis]|uniref:ABC transporter ATP-binding protein n=1 Tax=Streptomyces mirabilis TaxID=68239 RepID=UPI0036B018A9